MRQGLTLLTLVIGIAACGNELSNLPSAPSNLTVGVVLYEDANFEGASVHIVTHTDLPSVAGPCRHRQGEDSEIFDWAGCASSVRVAPGWEATLHAGKHEGAPHKTAVDVPNLQLVPGDCDHGGLNDCLDAVDVRMLP